MTDWLKAIPPKTMAFSRMRSGNTRIAPTTRPVAEGEDPRSGRWSGLDKSECGLHA